jgi:hypothetical protein
MKTLGMTFLAVILPAFGQEPTYKAAQGFGFTNAMLTLGGTNQIQTESELFMAESWGQVNFGSEKGQLKLPGVSSDLLHPLRHLFYEVPRTSLHLVVRGAGITKVNAVALTVRLPNLIHPRSHSR